MSNHERQLTLRPPGDYRLSRDVCSYGYFLLAPNRWDVGEQTLSRGLVVGRRVFGVQIAQPSRRAGGALVVSLDRAATAPERESLRSQISRMLRLDEDTALVRAFHRADPRWKRSGRARLFRSPTFFEDVVKTVTSCNITWPGTVHINRRLCEVLGARSASGLLAFPEARVLARTDPLLLRERCRVGYRDRRLVELATLWGADRSAIRAIESGTLSTDEIHERVLEWPGVGPYAAANLLQLLGRYERLPLDSESVRHGRTLLGFRGTSAAVMKRVAAHFAPFGEQAFRSYWFEMWAHYETLHGPASTWDRDTTGTQFTAAAIRAKEQARLRPRLGVAGRTRTGPKVRDNRRSGP